MLHVIKRGGRSEEVSFDKITNRLKYLASGKLKDGTVIGEALNVDYYIIAKEVIGDLVNGIHTEKLDELACHYCSMYSVYDHQYGVLAGRISVSNHHKNTLNSFADTIKLLYENRDNSDQPAPLINRDAYKFIIQNRVALDSFIDYNRDYRLELFGFKTLDKSYLLSRNSRDRDIKIVERYQHMLMRTAVTIGMPNLEHIKRTYDLSSLGYYTHATPTLFNACAPYQQLSSCFLLGVKDSIDEPGGIPDCWKSCALISKRAGGIGIGITPLRGNLSYIRGTNGMSSGIKNWARIFSDIALTVNQGGKRNGSIALYIEPWHSDIWDYLGLKKPNGVGFDCFYGLWIPDLFMKRVLEAFNEDRPVVWSLMCPDSCHRQGEPFLYEVYGEEFEKLYLKYEAEKRYASQIPDIRVLWKEILATMKQTGGPYILFKDAANRCSNQKNIGTIRNSNLCAEILEYSDSQEYAVCNLASLSLNAFVTNEANKVSYDFKKLLNVTIQAVKNLDRVIDVNDYPVIEAKRSNSRHRPVGLGVQGLADVFMTFRTPFSSAEAKKLNKQIFETIYFGAMTATMELARDRENAVKHIQELFRKGDIIEKSDELVGLTEESRKALQQTVTIPREIARDSYLGSYSSFIGSPMHQGKFQFDLWNEPNYADPELGHDWNKLREDILKYGIRNSLVTAVMPTASTSHILGNVECIEPFKSNILSYRFLAGEVVVINKYLQNDLKQLGIWNAEIISQLIADRGSVQNMNVPQNIKTLYQTAFELDQKHLIELARGRAPYICQTQSLNLFLDVPSDNKITNLLMSAWKKGLKTGSYYIRRNAIVQPLQVTVTSDGKFKVKDNPESESSTSTSTSTSSSTASSSESECLNCSA